MNTSGLEQQRVEKSAHHRWARYGPLILWLAFISLASTAAFSAGNTSRFIRPFLVWLFPNLSEDGLNSLHFLIRKTAHFLEYAVLGFLARRAFISSAHDFIRRRWFELGLLLIVLNSLLDEWHQSFVSSRTGSVYDCAVDIAGGLTVLLIFKLFVKQTVSLRG